MRTRLALLFLIAVTAGATVASGCGIAHAIETGIGPNAGVKGSCSNNDEPIACSDGLDGSICCIGPGGTSSGGNLDALIASACGCGA